MTLRIDTESEGSTTVVRVAGRLSTPGCNELYRACCRIEGRLVVDLSDLIFADATGIEVLRALREKGAEVRGDSPLIRLLLQGETQDQQS